MRIKFPSAFVHKRSQILMLRSIPLLSLPREILFFLSVHHFLTHSCLIFREFSSASNWKRTSQSLASKRRTHFFVIQGFVFSYWVKLKTFFNFVLFSQPYKLCTKRETNVGMVLSRKIT